MANSNWDSTNRGMLFHNDKKGNEKAPSHRGKLNVNGTEYELAAWERVSKKGVSFLSLTIQPPRERRAGGGPKNDEDIPW
jgi:uncharacterized protein (DUF736 family)